MAKPLDFKPTMYTLPNELPASCRKQVPDRPNAKRIRAAWYRACAFHPSYDVNPAHRKKLHEKAGHLEDLADRQQARERARDAVRRKASGVTKGRPPKGRIVALESRIAELESDLEFAVERLEHLGGLG